MARLAEPLMKDGGSLMTMSYVGAEEVIPDYGLMGQVKAALEAGTRYMAAELGPKGILVNVVSPGPLATRAASGIPNSMRCSKRPSGVRRCAGWWVSRRSAHCAPSWPATLRAR